MSGGPKRKRLSSLSVRFSKEERAELEAKAGGLPLGAYIKSLVLAEDAPRYRQRRKPPIADQKLLAAILARLGANRTAESLQEIAHGLRTGTLVVDEELAGDLHAACFDIAWMRVTLMHALGMTQVEDEAFFDWEDQG